MSRIRRPLGATLGLILVISAVAAASASAALPEFVPKSGSFPVKFTSTGKARLLETTTGETVTCTSSTGVGELTSSKVGSTTLTLKGCETTLFGFPISCKSSGKASGEIVTNKLSTELVYSVAKTKVLDAATGPIGGVVAQFECLGNSVVVPGRVVGSFPIINVFLHSTELVFKQTKGVQEFREFVDSTGSTVKNAHLSIGKNGGTPIESGQAVSETITFEGTREVEING